MGKRVGIFSDLHSDKRSLFPLVKTLKHLGVDSGLFLGDFLYKTMSDVTSAEQNRAHKLIEQLRTDTSFRQDYQKGLFSEEQINRLLHSIEYGKTISKKIVKDEYQEMKEILSGLELAVVGGNWDYKEEIEEVFRGDYLNASTKNLSGLNVLGFSGGGTPTVPTSRTETLADDEDYQGLQYHTWTEKLRSNQPYNADILISHMPTTDGENVKKENAVEYLKSSILARKSQGLDVPEVHIHGHRHATSVKYDEEMEAFLVNPGPSGSSHGADIPAFLVGEFDDQNKLTKVNKYEILSSLKGLTEVKQTGHWTLDYENKKAEFVEENIVILEEKSLPEFKNNLSLDDNLKLTEKINVNYSSLSNALEKDTLLRSNILVMSNELEEAANKIKTISINALHKNLVDGSGNLNLNNLEQTIDEIHQEITEESCKSLGVDWDYIKNSFDMDSFEGKYLAASINKVMFGINHGSFAPSLREEAKKAKSVDDLKNLVSPIIEESQDNLSKVYQSYILNDVEDSDYQEMAELYMPQNFERKHDLFGQEAFQLWLKSYKEGMITSDYLDTLDSYVKKEDFVESEISKEEIFAKFGFSESDEDDQEQSELEGTTNDIPAELIPEIRDKINSGEQNVISVDDGEYIVGPNNKACYLTEDFAEGLNYTPKTQNEDLGDKVKARKYDVVRTNDGEEVIMVNPLEGRGILIDNLEEFGLQRGDYQPLSEAQFGQKMQQMIGNNPRSAQMMDNYRRRLPLEEQEQGNRPDFFPEEASANQDSLL